MSLLLVILAALGVLAVMAAQADTDGEVSDDPGSKVLRLLSAPLMQRRADADPLSRLGDPMMAATVMMHAVAGSTGDITATERREIQAQMRKNFWIDGNIADEILAAAEPIAGRPADLGQFLPRLRAPIVACCDLRERRNLIDMLSAVAHAAGPPSDMQAAAIERLRPHLGLPRG